MAVPQSFPAKIYQILENESPEIIQWNENGLSFRIVDHGRFEREIVPKYFRHNQISSVQRQLNLYGFKCISRGEFKRSFFHPKFKKGDWETVRKLTRYIPVKKNTLGPDKSDDGTAEAPAGTSQSDVKQPTTLPMFMPYIYPYPHAIHPGQIPHGVQMRAYSIPPGSTAGTWPEGWGQGVPHGAYPQHTQNGVPQHQMFAVPTAYPAPQSADNKVSELSNRLGFQSWVPENGVSTSQSSNNISTTAQATASIPKDATEPAAVCSEQHSGLVTVNSNSTVTVNPDYDLMAEFGIFDFPELMRPSSPMHATSTTTSGPTESTLNLPSKIETSSLINTGSTTVMTDASQQMTQSNASSSMSISSLNHPLSHAAVLHSDSLSNVSTPKMRQSGVDVACNTALTYSKDYDCFVLGPDV